MHRVNPTSLKNLRRPAKGEKPRNRDGSPAVSPGRPRTADLRADILADYLRHGKAFVQRIRTRKPELYAAYGFGRPPETIMLGGVEGKPLQVETPMEALTIPQLKERLAILKAKANK